MTEKSEALLTAEIGERLKYARVSSDLSLSQLSELTGGVLSKSRISNSEQGTRRPSVEAAKTLAAALGTVTPAYLLCIDDPMNLSPGEIDLITKYRAADAKGQAEVRIKAEKEAQRTQKEER